MKLLLLVSLSLLFSVSAFSQNWRCLQASGEAYYHNHYLRGISIDSVKVANADTILHPFRSPRGPNPQSPLVHGMGSWLGKEVIMKQDGTTIFDTYWGDSVFINTRAALGESWNFYNDTSNRHYIATITSVDTMTLLNVPDSIKEITIAAYAGGNVNNTDLAHNRTITISKHHGLVDVFSLYTFPFHPPDTSVYVPGVDWLMDKRDVISGTLRSYHLIADPDPTELELYDYDAGDVLEYLNEYMTGSGTMRFYWVDSILSRTVVNASQITYQVRRIGSSQKFTPNPLPPVSSDKTFSFSVTSNSLGLINMPEKETSPWSYVYKPNDSSHCLVSALLNLYAGLYNNSPLGAWGERKTFKAGFGMVNYHNNSGQPNTPAIDTYLIYSYKKGLPCGSYFPLAIHDIASAPGSSILVYPVPAATVLHISCGGAFSYQLTDIAGRLIRSGKGRDNVKLPVHDMLQGMYILTIKEHSSENTSYRKVLVER